MVCGRENNFGYCIVEDRYRQEYGRDFLPIFPSHNIPRPRAVLFEGEMHEFHDEEHALDNWHSVALNMVNYACVL